MKVFRIQASVMSSVLVVSTLMFIGMLGVLFLWDSEHLLAARYFFREQQRAHLSSAVVKYCQDTSFCIGFRQDTSLMLFPGLATSEVGFYRKRWGLYEMLLLTAGDEKKCCLMGKVDEGYSRAALYLPERGRTLSIAGKSRIEGKLYIGGQGVAYTQVRSEFFDGTPVAPSDICRSGEMLPSPAPEITAYVGELFRYAIEEWPEAENFGQATFAGPVEYRRHTPIPSLRQKTVDGNARMEIAAVPYSPSPQHTRPPDNFPPTEPNASECHRSPTIPIRPAKQPVLQAQWHPGQKLAPPP